METLPQIQTIIDEYAPPISTIIDAPWVNVTSVNGMTGDVIVEVKLSNFEPNHYYPQGTAIIYNGSLYYAKQDFTSGYTFNLNDWNYPQFEQEQADWNTTSTTSNSYIKNKPTKLSQFSNDLDLINEDDINAIITTRIVPLEEEVDNLNTDLTQKVNNNTDLITQVNASVSNLSTTVEELDNKTENMKTDGSVVKLGTSSVGNTGIPIYLNSGTPTICTVGEWGGLVNINSLGGTTVGETVYLTDRNGITRGSVSCNTSGLILSSPSYVGSVSSSNRVATIGDIPSSGGGAWELVNSKVVGSGGSTGQLWASVPSSYRGYPWEYKVVFGYEVTKNTSGTCIVTMTMDTPPAPYESCFVGVRSRAAVNYTSTNHDATFFGHEWYIYNSNESCAGEVLVGRAGSGNFWNAIGKAGGMSDGPCALTVGSRTIGSGNSSIDYFNLNLSTSATWLEGSHIEIFARKYT